MSTKASALRPLVAALFFTLCQTDVATAQAAGEATVTLDQARAIGRQALASGNTALALQVAAGLLQADPRDEYAHFLMAAAFAQANAHADSRRAAAKAYRYTDASVRKFEAAQLAARMSFQGDRPTLAQLWLRRAANHAPNDQAEAIVARDYKRLRQINPWSFRLGGGITPTDNVNNGTDANFLIIDGIETNDALAASQPLSGVEGHLDLQIGYRLRANQTSATQLSTRLYMKRVKLSDEAQAIAPTRSSSDFAYTYFDTGLRHAFTIGENGTTAAVSSNIGLTWFAGDPYTRFFRVKGDVTYKLSERTSLTLDASLDQQNRVRSSLLDTTTLGFGAQLKHRRENGDTAGIGLYIRDTASDVSNRDNEYIAVRASYALGKPVGPVSISGGLTYHHRNYDSFLIGVLPVLDVNRQDSGLSADVTFVFNDISYAGFVPSVTVRARNTQSNVNLYETRGLSVSMGIQSKF